MPKVVAKRFKQIKTTKIEETLVLIIFVFSNRAYTRLNDQNRVEKYKKYTTTPVKMTEQ